MTQVPNNILNSLWIDNFTRANAMHEQLTVSVSFDTSFAEIQALREEMEVFVRDPANSRDFQSDFDIEVVGVGDMDKLELRVDIRHKSNWSNETVRAARRSKFMCALVLAMRKVPIRAPGAAAPEEESKDDGDDKADGAPGAGDNKSAQAGAAAGADGKSGGLTPAAAAAASGMMTYDAQTTGFEQNRSSGSVTHRGSMAASQREAAIADRLNARSPVVPAVDPSRDANEGLYRTTTNTSNQGKQLSVYDGITGVSRGLSTGHRKAGVRASYHDDDAMPPPLSPVAAGMTPSHSGVPILNTPAPPGSRGSTRYEPPTTHAPTSQPGAHQIGSFAQSYYGHESAYDSVPLNGITPDRATASSSQYDVPDRYDPVSPPSIYSPPQPQAPAPSFKNGRKNSPYGGEHEA
jgi:hypothetical protein